MQTSLPGPHELASDAAAITILFTDIEGSSALVESLGDRGWLERLRLHDAIVRECVESFRGFEVKTVGDGFMVVFTSPDAAVGCAAAIQAGLAGGRDAGKPDLRVRIGLHTGPALRVGDDFFGREVVMAARVSAQATGGEILISDAVLAALDGSVAVAPPRVVKLRGLRGTHRVYSVLAPGEQHRPPVVGPARAQHARLAGRDAELSGLVSALESAAAGDGLTVVVAGAPGVGKSALLGALVAEAQAAGFPVLAANGSELERSFPFGVARQLFETTLRRLPDSTRERMVDPAARGPLGFGAEGDAPWRFATLAAIEQLAARLAAQAPLVLVVDDAHWADDASLEALAFIARRIERKPLLLAVGARSGAELPAALDALAHDAGSTRIELSPLDRAAVAAVVSEMEPAATPAFLAACHRASGGVPLYLRELLAAARAQAIEPDDAGAARLPAVTPESVRRMVLARLEPLGADAQAFCRACATLHTTADLRLAGTLAELSPAAALAAADALCAAGILEARRPLRFAHPIVRAVVEQSTPFGARSGLHAAAARLLAADGAAAQEVGAHLLAAEPAADHAAVALLRAAARAALADGAPAEGARFLERALMEPPAPEDEPALVAELARAHHVAGDSARAVACARRAAQLHTNPPDRARAIATLARASAIELLRTGSGLDWQADCAPVVELVDATVPTLREGDRVLRFELEAAAMDLLQLRGTMSSTPMSQADVLRLERLAAEATGGTTGERELLGVLASREAQTGSGTRASALALARRALDGGAVVRGLGSGLSVGTPIETLMILDAHAEAEGHLAEAASLARRHGSPAAAALIAAYRAANAWFAGALEEARERMAQAAGHLGESAGDSYVQAVVDGVACGVLLARGEVGEAATRAGAIEHARLRSHALGLVAAARGDHVAACEHLWPAQQTLDRRGLWRTGYPLRPVRPDLAVSLAAAGDDAGARELLAAELEVARRFGVASCLAEALRAQAAVSGDPAPLREAAAAVRGCEARLVEARVLLELGLATAGDESRSALERALALAGTRGADAIAAQARDALAD